MSGDTHNDHAHGHDAHGDDMPHGSVASYALGFALSVLLTAVPFWLVMTGTLHSTIATAWVVMLMAGAQILVQMIFFLHLDIRSEKGWRILALLFTVVVVVIAFSGSLWIMHHLTTNMMPPGVEEMKNMA